jgi:protease IV
MSEQEPTSQSTRPATQQAATTQEEPWERAVIQKLASDALAEQRRARRWNMFFKGLFFAYLVALLVLYSPGFWPDTETPEEFTALVDLNGVIAPGSDASADRMVTGLRAAFENEQTKGIIIRINSPGGSPVQSSYINGEIRRLRVKHPDTPVYAVIADVCASGGYYVAAAADKIYANESSVVGSIGVLMNGFGFPEVMKTVGVERRLHTAGARKGFLDPFTTEKPEDVAHVKQILDRLHQEFIKVVKEGRGDRLQGGGELFSGLVWDGKRGVELGLVDALGNSSYVAREVIGAEDIVDFTPRPGFVERITDRLGASIGNFLISALGVGQWQMR